MVLRPVEYSNDMQVVSKNIELNAIPLKNIIQKNKRKVLNF